MDDEDDEEDEPESAEEPEEAPEQLTFENLDEATASES